MNELMMKMNIHAMEYYQAFFKKGTSVVSSNMDKT